ncbi:MAG: PAS domain S-box protein [Calditrichaeota bacterium]|nr:MAG: PAS domain S-box protein [Calditrichota bacterium]
MNPTEPFIFPKKWGTLRPKLIIFLVAILTFLAVVIGYFEISQSRRGIMELLQKEAETITEALFTSAENALQTYAEFTQLIERHLFNTAFMLIHLQNENALSPSNFRSLLQRSGVARAFTVNTWGKLIGRTYPADVSKHFRPENILEFVQPLFEEDMDRISGMVEDWEGKTHYAVAVKNTPHSAWVLCTDPESMLELRRRVGIGRIIQDLGENPEIVYIVLQDENGILSATRNVTTMPSLRNDAFLEQVLTRQELNSRVTRFQDQEVLEVVKPFMVHGDLLGVIRVGLNMEPANRAVRRTMQRGVLVLFGFIVIGVILFNFFVTQQNYTLLTEAYSKIKTYTGNILENMADAVVAVNHQGRITLFNRAAEKLFGKLSPQVVGKSCRDIIGEQTSLLDQTLQTGQEVRDREVVYHFNGHEKVLSVTTTLLRNNRGEIDSAVAVLKDLTEKKAWEERLRRQEKLTAMGELASGVAHEIRNPLNAISIIAQRLNVEFTPTENQEEYRDLVNSVISETKRVGSIIQRFLEFARPPKLNLQRLCLNQVIAQAVKLVENEAKEKGIQLKFEKGEKVELFIDGNQMEQVFLNLLQNSLQATPAGGAITVRVFKMDHEAVVEVSDTGEGIPPENLNRIFDLYFTTKPEGTGMGLSLSHRIVTEHGGRIEVTSKVNEGSTFRVVLLV